MRVRTVSLSDPVAQTWRATWSCNSATAISFQPDDSIADGTAFNVIDGDGRLRGNFSWPEVNSRQPRGLSPCPQQTAGRPDADACPSF